MPTRAASAFTYALLISSFVWASVTKPPSFWHYTNIRRIHNPEKTFSASDFSSETLTAALYTTDIFSKAILLLTLYHTILYNANFHFYIYFRCFVVFPVGNFHHAYAIISVKEWITWHIMKPKQSRKLWNDEPVATIASDLGVSRSTVYTWIKSLKKADSQDKTEISLRYVHGLERKITRLQEIIEILQAVGLYCPFSFKRKTGSIRSALRQI